MQKNDRAGKIREFSRICREHHLNSIHKPPALLWFRSTIRIHAVTVEPFQFSPAEPVAYEWSYTPTGCDLSGGLKFRDSSNGR